MLTYNELNEAIETVKQNEHIAVKEAEVKKEVFIREQVFSGDELLKMRDEIKNGDYGSSRGDKPWLNYVLDRILQYREE